MALQKMKVFIWEKVLGGYMDGMMVAIAPSVEEARAALLKSYWGIPKSDLDQLPQEFDLSEVSAPVVFACYGGG